MSEGVVVVPYDPSWPQLFAAAWTEGARLSVDEAVACVKTHLSHIYAKLGVANRTELATQAQTREQAMRRW